MFDSVTSTTYRAKPASVLERRDERRRGERRGANRGKTIEREWEEGSRGEGHKRAQSGKRGAEREEKYETGNREHGEEM